MSAFHAVSTSRGKLQNSAEGGCMFRSPPSTLCPPGTGSHGSLLRTRSGATHQFQFKNPSHTFWENYIRSDRNCLKRELTFWLKFLHRMTTLVRPAVSNRFSGSDKWARQWWGVFFRTGPGKPSHLAALGFDFWQRWAVPWWMVRGSEWVCVCSECGKHCLGSI